MTEAATHGRAFGIACPACGWPGSRPAGAAYAWSAALPLVETLSVRERDVLLLLAEGLSNRQIARELQLTERTVKSHLAQVMAKLGVDSRLRAGLVAFAYQLSQSRGRMPAPAA